MDIALRFAVEDLLARYVHTLDDGRLEEWPDLFAENGRYRVTTAENLERGLPVSLIEASSRAMLRDRVNSLRHANIWEPQRYRHLVSSTVVEAGNVAASALSCFQVIRIMQSGESTLFATGCYRDRIRVDGARALFEERIVVLDSRAIDTLLAIPL